MSIQFAVTTLQQNHRRQITGLQHVDAIGGRGPRPAVILTGGLTAKTQAPERAHG
jgi:hypothetical protein